MRRDAAAAATPPRCRDPATMPRPSRRPFSSQFVLLGAVLDSRLLLQWEEMDRLAGLPPPEQVRAPSSTRAPPNLSPNLRRTRRCTARWCQRCCPARRCRYPRQRRTCSRCSRRARPRPRSPTRSRARAVAPARPYPVPRAEWRHFGDRRSARAPNRERHNNRICQPYQKGSPARAVVARSRGTRSRLPYLVTNAGIYQRRRAGRRVGGYGHPPRALRAGRTRHARTRRPRPARRRSRSREQRARRGVDSRRQRSFR